jgi:hypothetical protein
MTPLNLDTVQAPSEAAQTAGFLRAHAARRPDSDLAWACLEGADALELQPALVAELRAAREVIQAARDWCAGEQKLLPRRVARALAAYEKVAGPPAGDGP